MLRWVLMLSLLSPAWVWAEGVTLRDGSVREGRILKEDERTLTLEVRLGALRGTTVYEKGEVAVIDRTPAAPDPVEAEAAKLRVAAQGLQGPPAAKAWLQLGELYARRPGYSALAREAWEAALKADPQCGEAHRRLGHVETAQGWQAVGEQQRSAGLVPLGEAWVKPGERAWLIDRRPAADTEFRIEPRGQGADQLTAAEVARLLEIKRAEERAVRPPETLAQGQNLLEQLPRLYAPAPSIFPTWYAEGVGLSTGNQQSFFGTVSAGFPLWTTGGAVLFGPVYPPGVAPAYVPPVRERYHFGWPSRNPGRETTGGPHGHHHGQQPETHQGGARSEITIRASTGR